MEEYNLNLKNVSKETVKIIGAELKRRRLYQSKTLVNLSSICSVSYISKIENGKIIPKYHVLRDLCEEHGITKEELDTLLEVDTLIEKCVEGLFWNSRDKIKEIYERIYLLDNYKVNLIKTIYEIMFQHWDKVLQLLNSIRSIKDNLGDYDSHLYDLLKMFYENSVNNFPDVYKIHKNFKYCKDNYLLALSAKQMFIAVAKYGLENPFVAYKNYYDKYISLFNYSTEEMYELYIEALIAGNYELPDSIKKELKAPLRLKCCLQRKDFLELEELLKIYRPSQFEKLLIATAKDDFVQGEKIFTKIKLTSLSAKDVILSNYCNYINRGLDEDLATYIIMVAAPFALKNNDGFMFRMCLEKLSKLAFVVGKYKAVATMNLTYFEMLEKCK